MTAHRTVPRVTATHLSPESISLLRSLLLCELADQIEQSAQCRHRIAELTGQVDVDSVLEREIAQESAARADEAVDHVKEALGRIEVGTYGICEACGAPIPFDRLEAIPHSRRCVGCLDPRVGLLA